MKSLLKKTFVSVVALFTILATVPAPAFAQIWEPPAGPPPSFNAPPPIHEGIEGQAKFWTDFNSNFSLGALLMLTQGLLSSYAIADGKGVAATQYCLGSMEDIENSNFPFGTEFLDCVTAETGWGGGGSLPDGQARQQLLFWDVVLGAWNPMRGSVVAAGPNVTSLRLGGTDDNPVEFPDDGSSPGLFDFKVFGDVTFLKQGFRGIINNDDGLQLRLQPNQQPIGAVPVTLDAQGTLGWSTGASGLPDATAGQTLFYNSQTGQWEASEFLRSVNGAQSKIFIGHNGIGGSLPVEGELNIRGALVLTEPNASPDFYEGKILGYNGGPLGNVSWVDPAEFLGSGLMPGIQTGQILAWNGEAWFPSSIPIRITESGRMRYLPQGETPLGSSFVSYTKFPVANGSSELTYTSSGIGMNGPNIVLDGDVLLGKLPPFPSADVEDSELVRNLCYEIMESNNGSLGALIVDCADAPESGSVVAVGTRTSLEWAAARAINIQPIDIVDSRTRYILDKPENVNSMNLIACGAGGGGGGGGAAKPSNVGSPSGGGGGGGAAGDCVQQSINTLAADQIEILVGNASVGGSRGLFWIGNNGQGYIPSANGQNGSSTIIRLLGNGSVLQTIEVSGGTGGGNGKWPGQLNQPYGAGGKGGFLVDEGIDSSDGFAVNAGFSNYNGGTGYGEVLVGPGEVNPIGNDPALWFNAIGYVSDPNGEGGNPLGIIHFGGRGGDGEFYSGVIPPGLSTIGGNSIGGSGSTLIPLSGSTANWVSGGAGGQGASNFKDFSNSEFALRGWFSPAAQGCQNMGGVGAGFTWCSYGGTGARGGPGFVQLSW